MIVNFDNKCFYIIEILNLKIDFEKFKIFIFFLTLQKKCVNSLTPSNFCDFLLKKKHEKRLEKICFEKNLTKLQ